MLPREGAILLDGVPLTTADRRVTMTPRTNPETRYERFDQVLAVMKRAGDAVGVRGSI